MKSTLYSFSKQVLIVILFFSMSTVFGQAPQKMSYQAVIRNSSSVLVVSAPIGMRISILQGSSSGSSVYTETQTISTNANGLVSLEIGTGTLVSGNFATINWANGPYFIKTETDPLGGTSYTITGTSQLSSVPYALFSAGSANGETPGTAVGDMKYWNGAAWVMIPVGTPGQFLQLNASNIPSWNGGTFATVTTDPIAPQTSFSSFVGVTGTLVNNGITAAGGSPVFGYGMCWSTSPNPTTANYSNYNPTSIPVGPFSYPIGNLLPNTTYYVRAYVLTSAGTAYGNQVTFTTFNPTIPTVTTTAVTGITGGVANSGGNVSSDGGAFVTAKGVCWSTSPNPTIADSKTFDASNIGSFSSIMNGLTISTVYYVRAYATNVAGTAYGNQFTFTTSSTLSIGSFYQGGLIGYFLQPSDPGYSSTVLHGIIISKNDIATGVTWGCEGTLIAGVSGTLVGDGNQNTLDILAGCSTLGIAAELCNNLVLNSYSDWFLPGDAEWVAMDANLVVINGIANTQGYWTSNQVDATNAHITFNNYPSYTGYIGNIQKNDASSYGGVVRAVRMF